MINVTNVIRLLTQKVSQSNSNECTLTANTHEKELIDHLADLIDSVRLSSSYEISHEDTLDYEDASLFEQQEQDEAESRHSDPDFEDVDTHKTENESSGLLHKFSLDYMQKALDY
jgi:hypothetical protein